MNTIYIVSDGDFGVIAAFVIRMTIMKHETMNITIKVVPIVELIAELELYGWRIL